MALFDSETNPAVGGAEVTPSGELDATQEQVPIPAPTAISVPDVSPIVAAMPGHTPLPPPQPIPNPANDPGQRLIALFTAGLSAGLGPHSGVGAGLGYHLAQQQQEQHDLALKQWQLNENERQRQIQAITQQNAELDRQRANSLQTAFGKIGQAASTAETKDEYDKAMDQWGAILGASGFRVSPTWLRQNFPWQAPSRIEKIKKAVAKFKANPNNQRLLDQQPELASQIQLNIDEGMPVPLSQALEAIGEGFAKGPNGELLIAPKPMAGTAPFDVILNGKMKQWRAENPGKVMDARTENKLIADAAEQAKEKPPESALDQAVKQSLIDERNRRLKDENAPLGAIEDAQTTISGRKYLDVSQYQTPSAREKARAEAKRAGITVVNKEVADGLRAADTARANLSSLMAQIEPYLAKDASGRLVKGPANTLGRIFQTNPTLGAYASWRTAAVQAVQALAEKGMGLRLNRAEIDLMLQNDIPQLTDDAPTAKQRVNNLFTLLDNKEKAALVRDRSIGDMAPTSNPLDSAKSKLGIPK